jgi:hypothetical protein
MKLRQTGESAIMLVSLVMNLMALYLKKANVFFVALFETLYGTTTSRSTPVHIF